MRLEGIRNTLNYAANRIRYLAPVPAGSRLRGRILIAAVKDAPPDGSQNQGQNPLPCHPSVTPGRHGAQSSLAKSMALRPWPAINDQAPLNVLIFNQAAPEFLEGRFVAHLLGIMRQIPSGSARMPDNARRDQCSIRTKWRLDCPHG
jgi:hypothetical protein